MVILTALLSACAAVPGTRTAKEGGETITIDLQHRADAAYQRGDMAASEQDYLTLVKRMPGEALYWYRLGNIYARTERLDAAIVAYRQAVQRNPEYTDAWYNMGIIQLKQAASTFNELQARSPSDNALNKEGKRILEEILNIVNQD